MRTGRMQILSLALAMLASPAVLHGQQPRTGEPGPRTIRVVGTGEARAAPDEAYLDFGVETTAPTAQAAAEQNARAMEQVIRALTSAGIPRRDIETRNFSVFPDYAPPRPGTEEPTVRGYRVTNVVTARTERIAQVGSLVDAALRAGANRVHGVRFAIRDPGPVRAEAIRNAVAKGRADAAAIAGALGVRLGPVLDASTAGGAPPVFAKLEMAQARDFAGGGASTPIESGEQTVTASVTLVYLIEG
ncbi:MAG TPA: SIMPL domain-containing protein [Longimicrobiaceae bacterium]|nr:SIMPL domain-containing protein [Longimicrobiaceae bacterium]